MFKTIITLLSLLMAIHAQAFITVGADEPDAIDDDLIFKDGFE